MKYFKHMSIMSDDTKLKRIKRKYGLAGYGLYVLMLEYISKQLDKHSPLPDLQETAEDISDEWNCDIRVVNEMMLMMVNEGLFEVHYITGRLVCTKIEKYLDEYIRKVPDIGIAITEFKRSQDAQLLTTEEDSESVRQSPTISDKLPLEEKRIEEKRREDIPYSEIVEYLNKRCSTSYHSSSDATRRLISARWNEGFREDDFRRVIDSRADLWEDDDKMSQYLRPQTLFGTKFESYLNAAPEDKPDPIEWQHEQAMKDLPRFDK